VKTNVGHTSAASGVTSVIKTLLCLHHKKLVPSLHYEKSNEHINFENSPFYVNTKLKDWTADNNTPRRAAISSFGFSGTNAHMVIEEAPQRIAQGNEVQRPCYLINLSAKTQESLDQKLKDLQDYLQEVANEEFSTSKEKPLLANMSYTLLLGRSNFNHRCAMVVKDMADLKETLQKAIEQKNAKNIFKNVLEKQNNRQIALRKYGDQLTETLAVSNDEDKQSYQENLLALADLFSQGYDLAWEAIFKDGTYYSISLPTYPFARERYWIPESDVQEVVQVNGSVSKLHPLLERNTSDLTEQQFTTRLTGREFFLRDHVVQGEKVFPELRISRWLEPLVNWLLVVILSGSEMLSGPGLFESLLNLKTFLSVYIRKLITLRLRWIPQVRVMNVWYTVRGS